MVDPLSALRALNIKAPEAASSAAQAAAMEGAGGSDFASVLADVAASGMKTVETGEATLAAYRRVLTPNIGSTPSVT